MTDDIVVGAQSACDSDLCCDMSDAAFAKAHPIMLSDLISELEGLARAALEFDPASEANSVRRLVSAAGAFARSVTNP